MMNWDEVIAEGYVILNPDCKAAQSNRREGDS